jgi:hypothetical protein
LPTTYYSDNNTSASAIWLGSKLTSDTVRRMQVQVDGAIKWGTGGSSNPDTQLARTGSGELTISNIASSTKGNLNLNSELLAYNVSGDSSRKIYLSNLELPSISSLGKGNILFQDTSSGNYLNMFLVMVQDMTNPNIFNPILAIDQRLWVEKDVQTYGMFSTTSDPAKGSGGGAILMGHGFEGASDPPKIVLTDNGFPELYIYQGSGSYGDIRVRTAVTQSTILNGVTSDPSPAANGQMWFRSDL